MADPVNSSWSSWADILKGHMTTPYDYSSMPPKVDKLPSSYSTDNSTVIQDDTGGPPAVDLQSMLKNAIGNQSSGAVNYGAEQQMPVRPPIAQAANAAAPQGHWWENQYYNPGHRQSYYRPYDNMAPKTGMVAPVYEPMHDRAAPPSLPQATQEAQADLGQKPQVVQPRRPVTPTPQTARPAPAPAPKTQPVDPNAGMHKVWFDQKGNRAGVGNAAPSGVDPSSFDYEPDNMTFMQRLVRGAFDAPQKASGGPIEAAQRYASGGAPEAHSGIINMAVGGRTDHIPMNVLEGSYVLPADIVSGLGEGNTLAGAKIVDNMFKGGPFGFAPSTSSASPSYPSPRYQWSMGKDQTDPYGVFNKIESPAAKNGGAIHKAGGGSLSARRQIPIIAAGGEYVVHPEVVEKLGNGDMNKGHEYLDNFVKYVRKHTVKTLTKLPGPKKN